MFIQIVDANLAETDKKAHKHSGVSRVLDWGPGKCNILSFEMRAKRI